MEGEVFYLLLISNQMSELFRNAVAFSIVGVLR